MGPFREGIWKTSADPEYVIRVDLPKLELKGLRYVHIAHRSRLKSSSGRQVLSKFNRLPGKRHLPKDFKGLEAAKTIARRTLNLSESAVLEQVPSTYAANILVECALQSNDLSAAALVNHVVLRVRSRPQDGGTENSSETNFRRYIVDTATSQFIRADGSLAANITSAVSFDSSAEATRFSKKHDLRNVDLLLRINENPKWDVQTPLA